MFHLTNQREAGENLIFCLDNQRQLGAAVKMERSPGGDASRAPELKPILQQQVPAPVRQYWGLNVTRGGMR